MTLKLDPINPLATKVQTRDGRKARLICVDRVSPFPIIALVSQETGQEVSYGFTTTGKWDDCSPGNSDLINVPAEHRVWVNWSRGAFGNWLCASTSASSKADADELAKRYCLDRVACVEVVFKEGEGL